ncbi:FAD-binding protein, partial [candidate division WOR-3 bacterium]|nr:FAD-binding protein [candidate division WOR-3 bacterium]
TSLYLEFPSERSFLISESVRGEGAILVLKNGKSFMKKYHPSGSLAPRDVVARSITKELKMTGDKCVYLNLSKISPERIINRFPNIYNNCKAYGIDITKQPIPCIPSAHYLCGGILVDENGFTGIDGLYAAGETSCAGIHGSNRLASNSLLESIVFSERAAYRSINNISNERFQPPEYKTGKKTMQSKDIEAIRKKIKKTMWDKLGVIRNVREMIDAETEISLLAKEFNTKWEKEIKPTVEFSNLRNMITVARSIITSALKRKESRGLHWVEDYPYKDPAYERDTIDE